MKFKNSDSRCSKTQHSICNTGHNLLYLLHSKSNWWRYCLAVQTCTCEDGRRPCMASWSFEICRTMERKHDDGIGAFTSHWCTHHTVTKLDYKTAAILHHTLEVGQKSCWIKKNNFTKQTHLVFFFFAPSCTVGKMCVSVWTELTN